MSFAVHVYTQAYKYAYILFKKQSKYQNTVIMYVFVYVYVYTYYILIFKIMHIYRIWSSLSAILTHMCKFLLVSV